MVSDTVKYVIFIALYIVIITLSIFLYNSVSAFNQYQQKQFETNAGSDLTPYSADVFYYPFPSVINLENKYDCTPNDFRTCKLDDTTSCFGCKNLIAKCVHFDRDVDFVDVDGNKGQLKKNETENDGYCLAVDKLFDACDPRYGDYVIVSTTDSNDDDKSFYLICSCKYPGIVGSSSYTSNCNEIYVCNGDMDLDKFQCNCPSGKRADKINDIPVCVDMTVGEYEYADETLEESIRMKKDAIDKDIAGNLNSKYVINPAKVCPLTNKFVAGGRLIKQDDGGYYVAVIPGDSYFEGLPYRLNANSRYLAGSSNFADCILNLKVDAFVDFGFIEFDQETVTDTCCYAILIVDDDTLPTLMKMLNTTEDEVKKKASESGYLYVKMFSGFNAFQHVLGPEIMQGTNLTLYLDYPHYYVNLYQKGRYSDSVEPERNTEFLSVNGELTTTNETLANYLPGTRQASELPGRFLFHRGDGVGLHLWTPITKATDDKVQYLILNHDIMNHTDDSSFQKSRMCAIVYTSEGGLLRYSVLRHPMYMELTNKRVK